jgi:thiamine pyrophosphate-dependent acetolactate synthase large subunit-like protein
MESMIDGLLSRRWLVNELLRDRGEMLVVAGLGSTVWDCAAAGDHPLTFPVWAAMGAASTVGLGLALAPPSRQVLVVTGDGELLMQLGALATIAVTKPANLSIVVLDNERWGETGNQPTHTAAGVSLAGVARECGIPRVMELRSANEVPGLAEATRRREGPLFAVCKIAADKPPLVMPPRDGSLLKDRFRTALLGVEAAHG